MEGGFRQGGAGPGVGALGSGVDQQGGLTLGSHWSWWAGPGCELWRGCPVPPTPWSPAAAGLCGQPPQSSGVGSACSLLDGRGHAAQTLVPSPLARSSHEPSLPVPPLSLPSFCPGSTGHCLQPPAPPRKCPPCHFVAGRVGRGLPPVCGRPSRPSPS